MTSTVTLTHGSSECWDDDFAFEEDAIPNNALAASTSSQLQRRSLSVSPVKTTSARSAESTNFKRNSFVTSVKGRTSHGGLVITQVELPERLSRSASNEHSIEENVSMEEVPDWGQDDTAHATGRLSKPTSRRPSTQSTRAARRVISDPKSPDSALDILAEREKASQRLAGLRPSPLDLSVPSRPPINQPTSATERPASQSQPGLFRRISRSASYVARRPRSLFVTSSSESAVTKQNIDDPGAIDAAKRPALAWQNTLDDMSSLALNRNSMSHASPNLNSVSPEADAEAKLEELRSSVLRAAVPLSQRETDASPPESGTSVTTPSSMTSLASGSSQIPHRPRKLRKKSRTASLQTAEEEANITRRGYRTSDSQHSEGSLAHSSALPLLSATDDAFDVEDAHLVTLSPVLPSFHPSLSGQPDSPKEDRRATAGNRISRSFSGLLGARSRQSHKQNGLDETGTALPPLRRGIDRTPDRLPLSDTELDAHEKAAQLSTYPPWARGARPHLNERAGSLDERHARQTSLGNLKIPSRIMSTQGQLTENLRLIRQFKVTIENLRLAQSEYDSILVEIIAIQVTSLKEAIERSAIWWDIAKMLILLSDGSDVDSESEEEVGNTDWLARYRLACQNAKAGTIKDLLGEIAGRLSTDQPKSSAERHRIVIDSLLASSSTASTPSSPFIPDGSPRQNRRASRMGVTGLKDLLKSMRVQGQDSAVSAAPAKKLDVTVNDIGRLLSIAQGTNMHCDETLVTLDKLRRSVH
ncbi:uncharacterized protein L969DRAFT_92481 [Mixia osmundae IAM 14324]|uniref:Uncharacterized protein n=1 Tax=Mixia osmundae (strain CBS 9802 / IAM 14324 / JCM 22182 / KY 12970) TaxID=764103 RepID=G7DXE9_MIXOS|nr:uncharacterized protein L969DRAFT_92481 [Mixia osmundae IAM 14324]KEI41247.1 hypothetical protein L969DRAFT_92481 [Mixia osmundae IAM 14324]GAA95259.1 hypothetical protein E5Q_01915 [Mixia osmundae IAM 14324]